MSSVEPVFRDGAVVADVMLRNPKTLPGAASVSEVREQLDNPQVQIVLLADSDKFRDAVTQLPPSADPNAGALAFVDPSPETIDPAEPAETAFARIKANPHRRLIVLDESGTLLGLLCLNKTHTRFCGPAPRAGGRD